jgi:hypothetical protein
MYTEINLSQAKRGVEQIRECESKLKKEKIEINEVLYGLKWFESEAISEVRRKLTKQIESLHQEIINVQRIRATLEEIIRIYEKSENEILDMDNGRIISQATILRTVNLNYIFAKLKDSGIEFL